MSARALLVRTVGGLAITTGFIWLLLRFVDGPQIVELFTQLSWPLFVLGLALYVVIYLFRALRFMLLAPRTPYPTMLAVTAVHNVLLRLMPMRTGDIAYAFLLRRAGTAGLGEGLLSIVILRVLDTAGVVLLFGITLAINQDIYEADSHTSIIAAAVAGLLAGTAVIAFRPLLRFAARATRKAAEIVRLDRSPRVARILDKVDDVVVRFSRVNNRAMVAVTALTALLWLLNFGVVFVSIKAFSIDVGVAQAILGGTAAVVTGFLPIGGIGNFGALEAGWALGFVLVGFSKQVAVLTGIGFSLITFAYAVLLGLIGWIALTWLSRR